MVHKRVRAILVLVVCAFLSNLAFSQTWPVFINNKPFLGQVDGPSKSLLLEAGPLAKMTQIGLKVDEATQEVTLNGEKIAAQVVSGKLLVDAKDLVLKAKGKYSLNQEMKTVDIYLLAPKSAAGGGSVGSNTRLELKSSPGEYIGAGRNWVFTDENAFFDVRYTGYKGQKGVSFTVKAKDNSAEFHLQFVPNGSRPLKVGLYENTARSASDNQPGLEITSSGKGQSTVSGKFEVLDIGYGSKGPTHFAVDFLQNGEGNTHCPLTGSLRYKTSIP